MTKKNQRKSVMFAVSKSGDLYVMAQCVMGGSCGLLAITDGIPISFYGKDPTPYLKIDDAIRWCEKECAESSHYRNCLYGTENLRTKISGQDILVRLKEAKAKHQSGEMNIED